MSASAATASAANTKVENFAALLYVSLMALPGNMDLKQITPEVNHFQNQLTCRCGIKRSSLAFNVSRKIYNAIISNEQKC